MSIATQTVASIRWLVVAAMLVVGLLVSLVAQPAKADYPYTTNLCDDGIYTCQIRAANGLKCMNVLGAQTGDNVVIQQWTCNAGSLNSAISLEASAATPGAFYVLFGHSGKCLTSPHNTEGARLVQKACGGYANQRWFFDRVTPTSYQYRIRNVHSTNKCAFAESPTGNGVAINQRTCNTTNIAFKWDFVPR